MQLTFADHCRPAHQDDVVYHKTDLMKQKECQKGKFRRFSMIVKLRIYILLDVLLCSIADYLLQVVPYFDEPV